MDPLENLPSEQSDASGCLARLAVTLLVTVILAIFALGLMAGLVLTAALEMLV